VRLCPIEAGVSGSSPNTRRWVAKACSRGWVGDLEIAEAPNGLGPSPFVRFAR
jgi:hypothetical protein